MIEKLKSILRSASFTNFLHLGLNQGVNVGVALLITPVLYQRLGAEHYGTITFSLSIVMLFSVVVRYGFHLNGPKRIALIVNDAKETSTLINEILFTRSILSLVIVGLILVAISVFNLFSDYALILSFSLIVLFGDALMPLFMLQGRDKLSLLSKANAISKLFYLALVFFFVQNVEDAKWVNFLFGGTTLLVNIILLMVIYRRWSLRFERVKWSAFIVRLKDNFEFFISTIAGHLSVHGGFLILKDNVSGEELGEYSLAQRVAFLLRMVPVFLTQSILQEASRLFAEDQTRFDAYLSKAYKMGLAITFGIGVIFMIAAPWVILVVGGEEVEYSTAILRILCFIPFFGMLNVSNIIRILVAERKGILSRATWATAGIMMVMSIIGSSKYGGYGLAMALLISEVVSFAIHYYLLKNRKQIQKGT